MVSPSHAWLLKRMFHLCLSGREVFEKSIVLVENGQYKGFGYIDEYELNWGLEAIRSHLTYQEDHRDTYTIIRGYLKRNNVERLLKLSDGFMVK